MRGRSSDTTRIIGPARARIAGLLLASAIAGCQEPSPEYTGPDYPRVNLATGYRVDADWPVDPPPAGWGAMAGIAVDERDRVWTINRGRVPVQVWSRDGRLLDAWGEGLFRTVHQIHLDAEGNVWIADPDAQVVQKLTPQGDLLMTLGTPGEAGDDDHHFNRPTDVTVTRNGDVFVSDGYGGNRIVHFDAQGRFINAFGTMGVAPGQLSLPHGIAVDSRDRLYVVERNNVRIQVFDAAGTSLARWTGLIVPWGIWITPRDEVYVCGSSPMQWGDGPALGVPPKDQIVMKFDTTGRVLELWSFPVGEAGHEHPGELEWVHGIAVDSHGDLYLGDVQANRVQKFVRVPAASDR